MKFTISEEQTAKVTKAIAAGNRSFSLDYVDAVLSCATVLYSIEQAGVISEPIVYSSYFNDNVSFSFHTKLDNEKICFVFTVSPSLPFGEKEQFLLADLIVAALSACRFLTVLSPTCQNWLAIAPQHNQLLIYVNVSQIQGETAPSFGGLDVSACASVCTNKGFPHDYNIIKPGQVVQLGTSLLDTTNRLHNQEVLSEDIVFRAVLDNLAGNAMNFCSLLHSFLIDSGFDGFDLEDTLEENPLWSSFDRP